MVRDYRGQDRSGGWEAVHRILPEPGGSDELNNCEIICWPCYQAAELVPIEE